MTAEEMMREMNITAEAQVVSSAYGMAERLVEAIPDLAKKSTKPTVNSTAEAVSSLARLLAHNLKQDLTKNATA